MSNKQQYSQHYGVAMYSFKDAARHIVDLCDAMIAIDTPDAQEQIMNTIAKLARASIELEQIK